MFIYGTGTLILVDNLSTVSKELHFAAPYFYTKGDNTVKINVMLKEVTVKRNLQKIKNMLLYGKIQLSSIPRTQRIANQSIYIMAFRAANDKLNCEEFIVALTILFDDIKTCKNNTRKNLLSNVFYNYLECNRFIGEEKFEYYKKSILQQMQIY